MAYVPSLTTRKKDGNVHRYWSLVRSVRVGRRVIQQTVTHLGELDEQGGLVAKNILTQGKIARKLRRADSCVSK